jgi:PAS domain-containing protein
MDSFCQARRYATIGHPIAVGLKEQKQLLVSNRAFLATQMRAIKSGAQFVRILLVLGVANRARETERRLVSMVNRAEDAIIGKNADCAITNWNRAAEQMDCHASAEAVGRGLSFGVPLRKVS